MNYFTLVPLGENYLLMDISNHLYGDLNYVPTDDGLWHFSFRKLGNEIGDEEILKNIAYNLYLLIYHENSTKVKLD